jgi:hypothetical protein
VLDLPRKIPPPRKTADTFPDRRRERRLTFGITDRKKNIMGKLEDDVVSLTGTFDTGTNWGLQAWVWRVIPPPAMSTRPSRPHRRPAGGVRRRYMLEESD